MSIQDEQQVAAHEEWQEVEQAIEWIHTLLNLGMKPGLKRMEWMLEKLGHPERRLKFVHVGGTNGKGSTVTYLRHILEEAGFEVGAFTSPYMIRFQDRIQVNGLDIADQDLLEVTKIVKPLVDELTHTDLGRPTEFEVITMIALLYFGRIAYPDLVIWEVGLGGRLDSTNVVTPILSIITNVGYDHIHILGDQIEEIAYEKAGIIKAGVPLVTGVQNQQALEVIEKQAKLKKAALYKLGQQYQLERGTYTEERQSFSYSSMFQELQDLQLSMRGKHQIDNAAVALMALDVLKQYYSIIWDEEHIRAGLIKADWKGRLEKIEEKPLVFIDGAHNPEGMAALSEALQQYYADRRITLFFCGMKDKDLPKMMDSIQTNISRLILTQFDFPRAATAAQLKEQLLQGDFQLKQGLTVEIAPDWYRAYQDIVSQANISEVIILTGSLYFISEVRRKLKK